MDHWNSPAGRCKALEELDMKAPARDRRLAKKLAEQTKKRIAEKLKAYERPRGLWPRYQWW